MAKKYLTFKIPSDSYKSVITSMLAFSFALLFTTTQIDVTTPEMRTWINLSFLMNGLAFPCYLVLLFAMMVEGFHHTLGTLIVFAVGCMLTFLAIVLLFAAYIQLQVLFILASFVFAAIFVFKHFNNDN